MKKITKKMLFGFICAAFATAVIAETCKGCRQVGGAWICETCEDVSKWLCSY